MKLKEFDYELPGKLIAQRPLKERDAARLLVVDRASGSVTEKVFGDIGEYLDEGDCLVLNDTRVIPARLYGRRATGGSVEIFLLDAGGSLQAGFREEDPLRALVRPSKRIKEGEEIELEGGAKVTVLGKADAGRYVKFDSPLEVVFRRGHVPLPPYIDRPDEASDAEDYQTVYAAKEGATASPTAGLHFSGPLLERLRGKGVRIVFVTLHTSYGTFAPVKEENIEDHRMHEEYYEIGPGAAEAVNSTKREGGRVFAVGTTSTRVLETAASSSGIEKPSRGMTNLFIYPGYRFKIVDGLITNFHLPESTLLMLVSAFGGKNIIRDAYKRAIERKFRFFSYGDAMLVI